jgi:hypothetical protein
VEKNKNKEEEEVGACRRETKVLHITVLSLTVMGKM